MTAENDFPLDTLYIKNTHLMYNGRPMYLFGQGYGHASSHRSQKFFDYIQEADWHLKYKSNFASFYPNLTVWEDAEAEEDLFLPFMRRPDGKFDLTEFDEEYFRHLREVCQYYKSRGVFVLLQIWKYSNFKHQEPGSAYGWTQNAYNPERNVNAFTECLRGKTAVLSFVKEALKNPALLQNQKDLITRILMATSDLGNIIYEIASEYRGVPYNYVETDWIGEILTHIRRYEERSGHRIVLTNMPTTADEFGWEITARGLDLLDISCAPIARAPTSPEEVYEVVRDVLEAEKPVIAGCIGPSQGEEHNAEDYSALLRRIFWAIFFAGGSGAAIPIKKPRPASVGAAYEEDDKCERYIHNLHIFIERLGDTSGLFPDDLVASEGWCALTEPGRLYVLYGQNGPEVELNLKRARGEFQATWFDPVEGKFFEEETIYIRRKARLKPPFPGDAALILQKSEMPQEENSS